MIQTNVWKSMAAGAIGGLVASFAMNQYQSLLSKASKELSSGEQDEQQSSEKGDDATVKTAKAISELVFDHKLTDAEKTWAGPAVHYGVGTLAGLTYGALAENVPAAQVARGLAYGTAVWLVADEIMVPAFGLSGPPTQTPASSHMNALSGHLVYGFVTDLVRRIVLRS